MSEVKTKRLFEDSLDESYEELKNIKRPKIDNLDLGKLSIQKLHEIILPSSTRPVSKDKSYMFCWNAIGKVLVGDHERIQYIEVELSLKIK